MTKLTVAISGGGVAGLCLAAELVKSSDIHVHVYEMSNKIDEVGAGITLWGRVFEALQLMGIANECMNASVASASTSGLPTTSATGFKLRGFRQPNEDFGSLPFRNAWSLKRADLIRILLRRVPNRHIHLGKKLSRYAQQDPDAPIKLEFSDGTDASCDVLIGCDGIRSATRAQMMRDEAELTGTRNYIRYVEPRWSGTIAYRSLVPADRLAATNPNHSLLSGGQIVSVVTDDAAWMMIKSYAHNFPSLVPWKESGYPVSKSTLNIAVSITDRWKEDTRWPLPSWSTYIEGETCKRKITPRFANWDPEAAQIIEAIDSSIEWAIMDLNPLPFYVKGRVALIGDAAHAAVPYLGAGTAFAIEDAYVLSRILRASKTTRVLLPLALEAYEAVRRPYGNKLVLDARSTLREFQYNGPKGSDTRYVTEAIRRTFEESAGVQGSGPEADANRAIFWMEVQERTSRLR